MFPEAVSLALDVVAVFVLFLAAMTTLARANYRPVSETLVALGLFAFLALAALSCSPAKVQSPQRETTAERCTDLMMATCSKFEKCLGIDFGLCMTEVAGCYKIRGITQEEADTCRRAIEASGCSTVVPDVCVGIAEAIEAPSVEQQSSPQPSTRDL